MNNKEQDHTRINFDIELFVRAVMSGQVKFVKTAIERSRLIRINLFHGSKLFLFVCMHGKSDVLAAILNFEQTADMLHLYQNECFLAITDRLMTPGISQIALRFLRSGDVAKLAHVKNNYALINACCAGEEELACRLINLTNVKTAVHQQAKILLEVTTTWRLSGFFEELISVAGIADYQFLALIRLVNNFKRKDTRALEKMLNNEMQTCFYVRKSDLRRLGEEFQNEVVGDVVYDVPSQLAKKYKCRKIFKLLHDGQQLLGEMFGDSAGSMCENEPRLRL